MVLEQKETRSEFSFFSLNALLASVCVLLTAAESFLLFFCKENDLVLFYVAIGTCAVSLPFYAYVCWRFRSQKMLLNQITAACVLTFLLITIVCYGFLSSRIFVGTTDFDFKIAFLGAFYCICLISPPILKALA